MDTPVSDIAFTPSVKAVQERLGSRQRMALMELEGGWSNEVTDQLAAFLADCDSFYLGTANAAGQPYIQHRGGPPGFLKVLDAKTLAFADFAGNRQYITLGNLAENDRAFLFIMDYPHQRRVKIWGRAEVVEGDAELASRLADPTYKAKPERVIRFHVEAWDINCPAYIVRRFREEEVAGHTEALRMRVKELEEELRVLRH